MHSVVHSSVVSTGHKSNGEALSGPPPLEPGSPAPPDPFTFSLPLAAAADTAASSAPEPMDIATNRPAPELAQPAAALHPQPVAGAAEANGAAGEAGTAGMAHSDPAPPRQRSNEHHEIVVSFPVGVRDASDYLRKHANLQPDEVIWTVTGGHKHR
jgi:hypothetical protein